MSVGERGGGVWNRSVEWWDRWFLGLAKYISTASKDPSTQAGVVIVDEGRRVVSTGYNGLPRGMEDSVERLWDRELKYRMTIHAEANAMLFTHGPVDGCSIYTWPFGPCSPCAARLIQAGIRRVVSPPLPESLRERWESDMELTREMFKEVGIEWGEVEG